MEIINFPFEIIREIVLSLSDSKSYLSLLLSHSLFISSLTKKDKKDIRLRLEKWWKITYDGIKWEKRIRLGHPLSILCWKIKQNGQTTVPKIISELKYAAECCACRGEVSKEEYLYVVENIYDLIKKAKERRFIELTLWNGIDDEEDDL